MALQLILVCLLVYSTIKNPNFLLILPIDLKLFQKILLFGRSWFKIELGGP
jgi:hypothetical protein